jgi:hypothetical protein
MLFTAHLLFKSYRSIGGGSPLWESSIILIEADSEPEALQRARAYGLEAEHAYTSVDGASVNWKFEQCERIFPIAGEKLESGMELFSIFLRESEVKSLLSPFDDDELPSKP